MAKATRGSDAQFTYDFGIAIAQGTLSKITRLTGVTLSLASAFYALKSTATEYVNTLRENTSHFGGILGTMKAMEQAQDRLIKGQSYFSVDDQLRGMNQLKAAGVNVGKNLEWISRAAHASGQSMQQFTGVIQNAIAGNCDGLVEMGLLTQRATHMWDNYAANTDKRQQAILNFVKNHKSLQEAIKNDFYTIQDQMMRLKETWKAFLQSILGRPNDPSSLYGQIVQSMKMVADALARNLEQIKRVGYVIGQVLGWVMKQIGHFVVWLGSQVKSAIGDCWMMTEKYAEYTRSLIVWLEFWKLKIVDLFKEYGWAIKGVIKLVIAYKALKWAFLIGDAIILSVMKFAKAIKHCYNLQMAYFALYAGKNGNGIGRVAMWFQSLAAWLPKPFRQAWVASGRYLGLMGSGCIGWCNRIGVVFKNLGLLMIAPFRSLANLVPGLLKTAFGAYGVLTSGPLAMFTKGAKGIHFKRIFLGFRAELISGLKNLLASVTAFTKPTFKLLTIGLKTIGNLIVNLYRSVGIALNAIKSLWTALSTNPVGWVILVVTAMVILYKRCSTVRKIVNAMFKAWLEYLKLLWNLLYGLFVYICVGCKKVWTWFKNSIVIPLANAFKNAKKWAKQFWNSFKDKTIGRFLNKYIVTPLKIVFEWLLKALHWVWDKLVWIYNKTAALLPGVNSVISKNVNAEAAKLGLPELGVKGNEIDTDDDTDYLSMEGLDKLMGGGDTISAPSGGVNPISDVNAKVDDGGYGGYGGGTTTNNNLNFSKGAIQIIVQKGEQIDEQKLARLVSDTIKETNREQAIRGGTMA